MKSYRTAYPGDPEKVIEILDEEIDDLRVQLQREYAREHKAVMVALAGWLLFAASLIFFSILGANHIEDMQRLEADRDTWADSYIKMSAIAQSCTADAAKKDTLARISGEKAARCHEGAWQVADGWRRCEDLVHFYQFELDRFSEFRWVKTPKPPITCTLWCDKDLGHESETDRE